MMLKSTTNVVGIALGIGGRIMALMMPRLGIISQGLELGPRQCQAFKIAYNGLQEVESNVISSLVIMIVFSIFNPCWLLVCFVCCIIECYWSDSGPQWSGFDVEWSDIGPINNDWVGRYKKSLRFFCNQLKYWSAIGYKDYDDFYHEKYLQDILWYTMCYTSCDG